MKTRSCIPAWIFWNDSPRRSTAAWLVIAGNNRRKTEYLTRAVEAGFHTLADKPMAIDAAGFVALEKAFAAARKQGVLLYDIMTERHEITTMLQKEFSTIAPVFGGLLNGSQGDPAVTKESVHHFSKMVSGAPLRRPAWFFDTVQQGEGLVDITTHLVDLVQWECFPDQIIDYHRDVQSAERAAVADGDQSCAILERDESDSVFQPGCRRMWGPTATCARTPTARSTTHSGASTRKCRHSGISRRPRARAIRIFR